MNRSLKMQPTSLVRVSFIVIGAVVAATAVGAMAQTGGKARPDGAVVLVRDTEPTPSPSAEPLLKSWYMQNGGRYARVVQTHGGAPTTTWPAAGLPNRTGGQTKPAYSDVQEVSYSTDWVYVKGTGLASHQMGPWYMGMDRIFDNWPTNQNYIRRFPRHPHPAEVKVANGGGPLGLWVNGVALFNLLDGFAYDSETGRDGQGGFNPDSTHLWARNAVVVEAPTFDASNAHQPPDGTYHYHDNPLALRYQLGDHVTYDAAANKYSEAVGQPHHSPILGWAYDGYPIYGPYGYSNPTDPHSAVRRMVSGYVLRDGANGTEDLRKTGRHSLAKWAATLHGVAMKLTADQYGPDVSRRATLGRYVEDFDYRGDHGMTQGHDFDLDIYNGRYCVTPEFPKGTYAYFVTLNADGSPAFPYVIGRQWYGQPSGGQGNRIVENVKIFAAAGPSVKLAKVTATRAANGDRELAWDSVEGAHYTISASTNGTDWTPVAQDIASQGVRTTYRLAVKNAPAAKRFEATVTALDAYDATGSRGMRRGGGQGGPGGGGQGGPGGGGPRGGGEGGSISEVSPVTAHAGQTVTIKLTLGEMPPPPPAEVTPESAHIGTLAAQSVQWDGTTVTATFVLPAGMPTGSVDVSVSFPAPQGRNGALTFTRHQGFAVH